MKDELEQQLERDFPFMKRDRNGEENLYQKLGCECDNGWFDLIHELCQKISDRFERDGKEPDILIEEIKEKYGTLRVEYSHDHFSGDNDDNNDFDKKAALENDIENLVDEYEEKSKTVCEMCGAPGKLREDLPWIQTLCVSCYAEQVKRVR